MCRLFVVLLAGLAGCKSAEDRAGETALAYASTPGWQHDRSWPMVCAEDQAAQPLAELQTEFAALEEQLPEIIAKAKEYEAALQFRIQSVALGADQTDATVAIEVKAPDKVESKTVTVRLEGERWCVATGWAEVKRLEGIAQQAEVVINEADPLMDAWKFDEAKAKLDEAEAVLAEIPSAHDAGKTARISLETKRSLLDIRSTNWIGGRWTGMVEKDPMTDATNAVARLESIDGLPNSIGRLEKASIILRCQKGKFEAYVNAGTVLDSNWRYDTVSGQHRFDGEKAQKLVGGVSTSRDSVFLRNPNQWAASFKAKDGSKWLVELPVYNRTPQTVTFDLTGSTKAVDMVVEACGG